MSRTVGFIVVSAFAISANLILLSGAPLAIKAVAALVLTWALPGLLLVEGLVARSAAPPEPWERSVYAAGAGYAAMLLTMLALSYLPGGLARWQTLAVFDVLVLALGVLAAARRPARAQADDPRWPAILTRANRRRLVAGLLVLLLVGGFYRFVNLGYAEFQGDEARAVLRAAAVLQGYDDALLIHKKGPTEILLPAAIYSLTGSITENLARLPFALANLTGLFALCLLGWRLFGPVAGWVAAILLALDGYFIGFSRIVQYQSVVFLTSVLVVLILYRLVRRPEALPTYLTLAALLLATGLLSHYEAALVALPAAYLLWVLWRRGANVHCLARSLASPVLLGGATLAAFYLPFVLHPNFRATYSYLSDRRIGGSFPYNNIADFFLRTTVYSTTYYLVLMIGLAVLALAVVYRGGVGPRWGALLAGLLVLGLGLTAWVPGWLTVGEADYTVVFFLLALLAAWLMPGQAVEERTLWLWFGVPLLLAFFFTVKPRTHVYVFFIPWALLSGMMVERSWCLLCRRLGRRAATVLGAVVALLAVTLFGSYAYWYFVYNGAEVLRTWEEHHPRGYWTVYATPDDKALFGFPLRMGWKVVGELYRTGELTGAYETNEKEAWVPDWYTRGARRCGRTARYFFLIDNLEPEGVLERLQLEGWLTNDWHPYGTVTVNGDPRMRIFERNGVESPVSAPRTFDVATFERAFDVHNAGWNFPLNDPVIEPPIPIQIDYVVGKGMHLVGYGLDRTTVRPGEQLELTLFWRADQFQLEPYTVFIQIINPNVAIYGQDDSEPVCGARPTSGWDPGELIVDSHIVPIRPDADVGTFPLIVGMYQVQRGLRLDVTDANGAPLGNQIELTTITIEPVQ